MAEKSTFEPAAGGEIRITGPMTLSTVTGLYRQAARISESGAIRQVDLSGVSRVDSAGLALLLQWQAVHGPQDQRIEIINAPDDLVRIARLCAAQDLLHIDGRNVNPDHEHAELTAGQAESEHEQREV